MDRASVFSDDEVISLLSARFVPVAVDEWYHIRRKDPEGDFYRKVVYQRDGLSPSVDRTTQGFYIFTAAGELLRGWNNRDVPKMKRYLRQALARYRPGEVEELAERDDPRYARELEDGGRVAEVFSRITEAGWPPAKSEWKELLRASTGRDHLWIRKDEVEALARGELPESLTRRIARFHLIDNTRGEPPMWRPEEVRECSLTLHPQDGGYRLEGRVHLSTASGDRGYEAAVAGRIEAAEAKLQRFDVAVRGRFWGEGRFTPGAPPGKFTLAVAFRLADGEGADRVPPQGARDLSGYLGD